MTRGKNQKVVGARTLTQLALTEDRARSAEAESRRLAKSLADADAEIHRLRELVRAARVEHTKAGTYTDGDMIQVLAEQRLRHRTAVRKGFEFLTQEGADRVIPRGKIANLAAAFDCEPFDIVGVPPNASRYAKRNQMGAARLMDEAMKQGVLS